MIGATLALAAAASVSTAGPASADRTVVKHYAGAPASVGLVFCGAPRTGVDGAGRVCHLVASTEHHMSVDIADTTGLSVAGRVVFFGRVTGLGEPLDIVGSADFCDRASALEIPAAATHLDIEIGDRPDRAERPCGALTSGTYGTVSASFSP